jgi:hypothetical protein
MEHGAFACITNSRSGWGGTDENPLDSPTTLLTREFYHSFLGEGVFELGRAHAEAKERCIWTISTTRYDIYQSTLFGDPELKLRVTNEHACGDLDRSGDKVNLADFAEMAKCWDSDPTVDPSCANANLVEFDKHIIDLLDLQVLAELFLTVPTNYFPNCPTSITDPYPPSPATMSFATVPYATGDSSIEMVATTATDISGVEYYFTCTIGDGNDSGWQASRTYEDTGLSPATGYTYTVKAHDLSVNYRETAASSPALATTYSSDSTAPDPDPMSFATAPYATGSTSIMMVATTATDISGVEYYFTNTTIGDESHDSGWQPGTIYEDTGLTPETEYTYTVTAHDKSADENPTAASGPASATTDMANIVLSANGGFLEESLSDYTEYDGYGPSYLTDGVTNDVVGWCSKTTSPSTQEFVFSFRDGKNATLGNAVLHTGIPDGNYYSKDVEVWTSTDGSTFTLAGFDALEAVDNDSTAIDLGDVIAEYVKLVITSSHGTSYWELAEFEVYGTIIE